MGRGVVGHSDLFTALSSARRECSRDRQVEVEVEALCEIEEFIHRVQVDSILHDLIDSGGVYLEFTGQLRLAHLVFEQVGHELFAELVLESIGLGRVLRERAGRLGLFKLRTDGLQFLFAWESHGSTPFLSAVSVGVHNADINCVLFQEPYQAVLL